MDDPDSLQIQYEIPVLQHQQNLVELGLHQVDVIRRRRKRRGHRRFWVRPWIGTRRQFSLYDQLLVELRNEDQSRSEDHQAEFKLQSGPGLKLALTLRHLASVTKYHSMSYEWRVPHNNISLLIPKVCQTIIDDYKDEVMK